MPNLGGHNCALYTLYTSPHPVARLGSLARQMSPFPQLPALGIGPCDTHTRLHHLLQSRHSSKVFIHEMSFFSTVILYYTATQYILAIFISPTGFARRRGPVSTPNKKFSHTAQSPPLLCNSVFASYTPSDSRGRIPLIQSTMTPLPENCGIILPLNSLRSPRGDPPRGSLVRTGT